MTLQMLLEGFLGWVLYPLWLGAGLADYVLHRRTHIERTSGPRESWLHVAQFTVLTIALALVTWFEVGRGVFAALATCVTAHSAIAYADVIFTDGRRYIAPLEQLVHGYLEVLPVMALALVAILHWDALSSPDWALRAKAGAGPGAAAWWIVGSFIFVAGLPIAEELVRSLRGLRLN